MTSAVAKLLLEWVHKCVLIIPGMDTYPCILHVFFDLSDDLMKEDDMSGRMI